MGLVIMVVSVVIVCVVRVVIVVVATGVAGVNGRTSAVSSPFLGSVAVFFHPFYSLWSLVKLTFTRWVGLPMPLSGISTEEVSFIGRQGAGFRQTLIGSNTLVPFEMAGKISATLEFADTHSALVLALWV